MNIKIIIPFILGVVLLLSGCQGESALEKDQHEITTFAMDTLMQFSIYSPKGEEILTDIEQEVRRLEQLFSITMEDSDITRLNNGSGEAIALSQETLEILAEGKELSEETKGAFNIAISPLVKAWGFTTDQIKSVPSEEKIKDALSNIDYKEIEIHNVNSTGQLVENMAIDLGGIAKGYTAGKVTQLLQDVGVDNALINLGGNISAMGTKGDGTKWKIAIENPLDANDYIGLLEVSDLFVVTSGGYQRYFEENGKTYHHILDSETGYPADSGLLSVTVICDNATRADALTTALFVMGLEESLNFWKDHKDFEAIFVTEDGTVVATQGADAYFSFEGRDNEFVYNVTNEEGGVLKWEN